MASKKKHAQRSQKTYKYRMSAARHFLRGSLPYEIRKLLIGRFKRPVETEVSFE
jgi:hypothetical protein